MVMCDCANAQSTVVQSSIVTFPISGRVVIEARENAHFYPEMVFRSKKSGKVLLRSSIRDELLMPNGGPQPQVRYRSFEDTSHGPMIMAIAIAHGGSDNGYYLAMYSEINGRIARLNRNPIAAPIQGGYYYGRLDRKYGRGLAVWSFIWDKDGRKPHEAHYDNHYYENEIYVLNGSRLMRILKRNSRRMYDSPDGYKSFREIGIRVTDQRKLIRIIRDNIDLGS